MRHSVIGTVLVYILVFAWAFADTNNGTLDPGGRAMALGFLTGGLAITALFAGPALILAIRNRGPRTALILALCPGIAFLILALFSLG